ncbi:endomucin isoform X4 [Cervus elaphus]|uniref:endomucin isoform X4 n=1 Tax=Cervus elaphus TaxID=9860 RepID=UPI001CC2DCAC|nr:endomucin isoform X4 [Cervus elaphus]
MKLLQGPIFCLLLASISRSAQNTGSTTSTPLSTTNERNTAAPAIDSAASPNVEKSTVEISTKGARTENITETKLNTTKATVISQSLSNAVSTSQSSDSKTETWSSIKATEISVNTSPPEDSSFRTTTLSSISVTSPENISLSQGLENAKNASASTTSPSYSSIILPVVIALIVITLSVFALVGLYRMCWKTDPGTQENGNEQPQSDKESVKLLTVKTISHESGEHSAQGKTKN